MEGFGNAPGLAGPFDYGSVKDGYSHNPTIEQRLKKKFWKTKQTVRQKLNKREDEFVVAGDAAIDSKLDLARHLGESCSNLITATNRCIYHIKYLSAYEEALGNYLSSCGELDFTLAGQIMTKTGEAHKKHADTRLLQIPGFMRLQAETTTFANSGLGDLNLSIDNLERARKDYRAALLWMKDVSAKLHNPDAKGQLIRFREAQAQVKLTKERFEHLKELLSEKILMVSASRCNLLSNVLPIYQSAMLEYFDRSANDLHKLLDELRSQTQHQYKVKDLSMEIRDLEVFEEETAGTTELGQIETEDTPTEQATPTNGATGIDSNKENKPVKKSLFGMLQGEIMTEKSAPPPPKANPDPTPPVSHDEDQNAATPTPDIDTVTEDDRATPLQSDPPTIDNDQATSPSTDQFNDLLSLLDDSAPIEGVPPLLEPNQVGGVKRETDEWDTFMDRQDESGWGELVRHAHNNEGVASGNGWSQNIVEGDGGKIVSELEEEIDKMLSLEEVDDEVDDDETCSNDHQVLPDLSNDTFDPLQHPNEPNDTPDNPSTPSHDDSDLQLDPSLFQSTPAMLPGGMPPPLMPITTSSPLSVPPPLNATPPQLKQPLQQQLPFIGLQAYMGNSMAAPMGRITGTPGLTHTSSTTGARQQMSTSTKEEEKKKKWSNLFADLDPIANEKA